MLQICYDFAIKEQSQNYNNYCHAELTRKLLEDTKANFLFILGVSYLTN